MTKAAYVGVAELPAGYTKLEYVESNGNQYINTGYVQTSATTMEVDITVTFLGIRDNQYIFGAQGTSYYSQSLRFDTSNGFVWVVGNSMTTFDFSLGTEYTINAVTDGGDCEFVVNGGAYNNSTDILLYNGVIDTTMSMCLFGIHQYTGYGYGSTECRISKFALKDNGVLVRDYVSVLSPSGVPGMFDKVEQKFYPSNTSTALIAGPAVSGGSAVARKIKKGYIGVSGKACKIKKAYIGVGGVARPFWSGGELAYYGTATGLSAGRYNMAATNVGDYVLFAGGDNADFSTYATVDTYNTSLTHGTATDLKLAVTCAAAASVGNYAIVAGGDVLGNQTKQVNAYDKSLTRSTPTNLSVVRCFMGAASVGDYAVFAGGKNSYWATNALEAFNSSLTKTYNANNAIKNSAYYMGAASVGNYALFAGGYTGGGLSNIVSAVNASLTVSQATNMSVARQNLTGVTVGDYALFAGGEASSGVESAVDAYNASLTRSNASGLSVARFDMAATNLGGFALFGGGINSTTRNSIDIYDKSLTHTTKSLSGDRRLHSAATVGNYALFAGGYSNISLSYLSSVEVFTIA